MPCEEWSWILCRYRSAVKIYSNAARAMGVAGSAEFNKAWELSEGRGSPVRDSVQPCWIPVQPCWIMSIDMAAQWFRNRYKRFGVPLSQRTRAKLV